MRSPPSGVAWRNRVIHYAAVYHTPNRAGDLGGDRRRRPVGQSGRVTRRGRSAGAWRAPVTSTDARKSRARFFGVSDRRALATLVAQHPSGRERRRGPHAGISWLGSTWYHVFTRSMMSLTAAGSSGWNEPVSWNRSVAPFASTCGSATHA